VRDLDGFYRLVLSDLPGILPYVYTPTVGEGCQQLDVLFQGRQIPVCEGPLSGRHYTPTPGFFLRLSPSFLTIDTPCSVMYLHPFFDGSIFTCKLNFILSYGFLLLVFFQLIVVSFLFLQGLFIRSTDKGNVPKVLDT